MSDTMPSMTDLFLQLGLDAEEKAIAQFIKDHQLPQGIHIFEAPYWNDGQRQFLSEQITADATWALVVDQLNESLHEDAIKAPD